MEQERHYAPVRSKERVLPLLPVRRALCATRSARVAGGGSGLRATSRTPPQSLRRTHLLLAAVGVIVLVRRQFPGYPADLQSEGREEVNPEPLLRRTGGGEEVRAHRAHAVLKTTTKVQDAL